MDKCMYDNSKEALAAIMREHGAEALLGSSLKNFFNDYAPSVKKSQKNVVFFVIDSGAAEILKRNLEAGAEEQELAFRRAVQKVIDECPIECSEVESIMLEFTAALGWKINVQPQKRQKQQTTSVTKKPQTVSGRQKQQTSSVVQAVSVQPSGSLTVGQRNFKFGRYSWRVLDVQKNGKALLLAENILEQRPYHGPGTSVVWETCELREYLNKDFFQTFSSQEQSRIAQTVNTNEDNLWFGTPGGRSTTDRVFLLSIEEVVKYFGDSGDLRLRRGWYYENGENVLNDGKGYYINDRYSSARTANYGGKTSWWWLRSPGGQVDFAARVDWDGSLTVHGREVHNIVGGVRPALWLNL